MTDTITLDRDQRSTIRELLTAASTNQVRKLLTGVFFDKGYAVTTDSYRLQALELDTPLTGLVLSAKDLKRALTTRRINDEVTLTRDGDVVKAIGGKHPMALTPIQGKYPDWRQLVPTETRGTIIATLDEDHDHGLVGALKRAQAISETRQAPVPTHLVPDAAAGRLWVRASTHHCEFSEWVTAEFSGEVPTIAFNPRYLRDLVTFGGVAGQVTLQVRDESKPALVQAPGRTGLLMPVRL